MGIYLNPGSMGFQIAMNSQIFVDKTGMIRYINSVVNTNQRYVSVSRPRRFGKTMAADMLCAYYDRTADSRSMFEQTNISKGQQLSARHISDTQVPGSRAIDAKQSDLAGAAVDTDGSLFAWDRYLGKFDVVRLSMTDFIKTDWDVRKSLQRLQSRLLDDMEEAYPQVRYDPDDLSYNMEKVWRSTGIQFVIVIDEWDAIFRMRKEDRTGQTLYLNFLRDWLKDKKYIALAYMTGILPIKKYGEHSALNMFDEYSMITPMQLAPYTGFTEEEVKEQSQKYGRDFDAIRQWYDGYIVSDIVPPDPKYAQVRKTGKRLEAHRYALYSPLSVVNAVRTGMIRNYWNATETYEALAEYIRRDFDGLKGTVTLLMNGGRAQIDISSYQNDMTTFHSKDDILTLLIHLGYLGYNIDTEEVFIPNKEILAVFQDSTQSPEWEDTQKAFRNSLKLLKATWSMDENKVAELVEEAHDQAANQTYHDEAALSYAIQLAYYAAELYYTKAVELDSGKGYADIVYLPSPRYADKPALVVELKYNKSADTALDQIHRRHYPERLEHYKGNILLVGINYEKEIPAGRPGYKHHTCRIERA